MLFNTLLRPFSLVSVKTDSKSKYIFSLFEDNYLAIFDFHSCTLEKPNVLQLVKLPMSPHCLHFSVRDKMIVSVNRSGSLLLLDIARPKDLFLFKCFEQKTIKNAVVAEKIGKQSQIVVFGEGSQVEFYEMPSTFFSRKMEQKNEDYWGEIINKNKTLKGEFEKGDFTNESNLRSMKDAQNRFMRDLGNVVTQLKHGRPKIVVQEFQEDVELEDKESDLVLQKEENEKNSFEELSETNQKHKKGDDDQNQILNWT